MADMGNGYGSEAHLLRWMGRHREELKRRVQKTTGAEDISWLDFGFDKSKKWPDAEWERLDFLAKTNPAVLKAWKDFWPQTGSAQNWDAVARITINGVEEWLLVEAKANIQELNSSCQAKVAGGRGKIENALKQTKKAFEVDERRDWLKGYYQYCNRLAVLHFLMERQVSARLLFIYFMGDKDGKGRTCPKDEAGWKPAIEKLDKHVGLPPQHKYSEWIYKLFLPVCI